jgi:hypothetical protein
MIFAENPDGTWDGRLSEPLKIPLLGAKTAARLV